ncbi:hypothetical protein AV521_37670 [Streptomyces sp. IMTB 2501]|uniref:hypothetical protein n=1 Tax=Streptomyces sp. IMTB 2501 TaxID=1776340 RepID=UPI00096BEBF1|nr:hypothetical protein [Streptomyces sp. IMTB 2501]OLZ63752.1 hypothetical protein AV521_37670 [Streptomyces sp. IMTB 2501]
MPTAFWFWGGLDADTAVAALAAGNVDSLPSNHSPSFAPVIEPTWTTGVHPDAGHRRPHLARSGHSDGSLKDLLVAARVPEFPQSVRGGTPRVTS